MMTPKPRRGNYCAGEPFDRLIRELVHKRGSEGEDSSLYQEMMTTVLKLVDEKADRGDLKVINTALKELRYAFKILSPYRNTHKVSVFGSARTKQSAPEYKLAKRFAKKIADQGFMVITGGASGIMEAANAGAGSGRSFGLNIRLPHEQSPNPFISRDKKLMTFKYFFTRKLIFIKESDAVCLFPGGFGTHDEAFEALTLIQTGKSPIVPLVLLAPPGNQYWDYWFRFVKKDLMYTEYISKEDLDFIKKTDSLDEAVEEITLFYRNYHSSRYVNRTFVIRVKRAPQELIERLNRDYLDILEPKGKFLAAKAFPEEENEPELRDFARISLPFNRESYGRIRQAINLINEY